MATKIAAVNNEANIIGYVLTGKLLYTPDQYGSFKLPVAIEKGSPSEAAILQCVENAKAYACEQKPKGKGFNPEAVANLEPYFKDGDAPPPPDADYNQSDVGKNCWLFWLNANKTIKETTSSGKEIITKIPIAVTETIIDSNGEQKLIDIDASKVFHGDKVLISFSASVNQKWNSDKLSIGLYANLIRILKRSESNPDYRHRSALENYVDEDF
jgi:hypothetical protein